MNTVSIDKAFKDLISKRGVHKDLGIEAGYVQQLRYRMNHPEEGKGISLETKIEILKKSGWRESGAKFTREDVVDAVRFTLKQGAKAKEWGPEYCVEKWEAEK